MTPTNINVLLIEDDEIDRRAVRRAFRDAGLPWQITEASNGNEALAILRGEDDHAAPPRPYLILLDINMPSMNGIEFLCALRQESAAPSIRDSIVFILTTSEAEQDRRLAYEHHVAGYLVKSDYKGGLIKIAEMLGLYGDIVEFP